MSADETDVSVVIPTTGRLSVLTAVQSALAQSKPPGEVLVVAARPIAPDLRSALLSLAKVRIIDSPTPLSGGAARNLGITTAASPWIALLDDDDTWLPNKLEKQFSVAELSERTLLACAVQPTTRNTVWPNQSPFAFDDLSEFFFVRQGAAQGNYLQTSGLVCPKMLAVECPFDEQLPILQDIDWVLRLTKTHGAVLAFTDAPLVMYETGNISVSAAPRVHECRQWAQDHRDLLTPRAYSAFMLTVVAERAARVWDLRSFGAALRDAVRGGESRPHDVALAIGFLAYRPWIRRLRGRLTHRNAASIRGQIQ